jgi:hypothetical protein
MRTDPLRVAGWCVVMMACLAFILAVQQMAGVPELPPPPEPTTSSLSPRGTEPPPAPVERYVGNTNKHKFHRLTCQYATCKNCTVRFATREEAIAAGFRPGGCCHP